MFQFFSNLQRLDKITKSVKSLNLKTNQNQIKEYIKLQ